MGTEVRKSFCTRPPISGFYACVYTRNIHTHTRAHVLRTHALSVILSILFFCLSPLAAVPQLISHEVDHARPTSLAGHVNTSATSDPARNYEPRSLPSTRENARVETTGSLVNLRPITPLSRYETRYRGGCYRELRMRKRVESRDRERGGRPLDDARG